METTIRRKKSILMMKSAEVLIFVGSTRLMMKNSTIWSSGRMRKNWQTTFGPLAPPGVRPLCISQMTSATRAFRKLGLRILIGIGMGRDEMHCLENTLDETDPPCTTTKTQEAFFFAITKIFS